MKISYSWLKELVEFSLSPQELADVLTSIGIEVASIITRHVPEKIVAAQVLSCEKHPNADKLSVCRVDAGGEPLSIVCGAPNVHAGMRVACALQGCDLGGDFIIKKTKLRGVLSEGMLCSERELGLSDEHSGLMDLPDTCTVGSPVREYFPDDAIIEIELTPNRGDCLSILGVAREISAKLGVPLKPFTCSITETGPLINDAVTVTVADPSACPRYCGRLIRGVTIAPSPLWLRQRLRDCGIRPINNIVDITNYILVLFGQPMHAFDFARLQAGAICVKHAPEGLHFVTLDKTERILTSADLLIWDCEKPVALAGIMGGEGSQISEQTRDVFLECAFFEPVGIRKTAKRIDLSTDSSYRFERGVDWRHGLWDALQTATEMITRIAGGNVATGTIDCMSADLQNRTATIRPAQVRRILGIEIPRERIVQILLSLGLETLSDDGEQLTFSVPAYRHDLQIEADLIEEVGRIHGYDSIPAVITAAVRLDTPVSTREETTKRIRSALAFSGLHEVVTNSMTSQKKHTLLTPQIQPVAILNPLNPDMALLRADLLGSLLDVTQHNLNRRSGDNRFFEISKTFRFNPADKLPCERDVVAMLLEGRHNAPGWNSEARELAFWNLKGVVEQLAGHLGLGNLRCLPHDNPPVYFSEECALFSGSGISGCAGRIKKEILKAFDIKSAVYFAQFDITDLLNTQPATPTYSPLPRFPALERDFCFVMSEQTLAGAVSDAIHALSELITGVTIFDVYHGEKVGAGLKSVAYSVEMRAPDRTLTDREADDVSRTIIDCARERFAAVLRS